MFHLPTLVYKANRYQGFYTDLRVDLRLSNTGAGRISGEPHEPADLHRFR